MPLEKGGKFWQPAACGLLQQSQTTCGTTALDGLNCTIKAGAAARNGSLALEVAGMADKSHGGDSQK